MQTVATTSPAGRDVVSNHPQARVKIAPLSIVWLWGLKGPALTELKTLAVTPMHSLARSIGSLSLPSLCSPCQSRASQLCQGMAWVLCEGCLLLLPHQPLS